MKPYIGLVHKDETSAYGITFPDAPGCFSATDELDEVFAMAQEALALWLEETVDAGSILPATRDLSVIKADPRWTTDFAEAALVIAVEAPIASMRHAA